MKDASQYGRARIPREDGIVTLSRIIPPERGAEWAPAMYMANGIPFVPTAGTSGSPVFARLNWGRWLVECPTGDGGAQLACFTDQRFLCHTCGNVANNGDWYPVEFPPFVIGIEHTLHLLPERAQNWEPGQTMGDLVKQVAEYLNPPISEPPRSEQPAPEQTALEDTGAGTDDLSVA